MNNAAELEFSLVINVDLSTISTANHPRSSASIWTIQPLASRSPTTSSPTLSITRSKSTAAATSTSRKYLRSRIGQRLDLGLGYRPPATVDRRPCDDRQHDLAQYHRLDLVDALCLRQSRRRKSDSRQQFLHGPDKQPLAGILRRPQRNKRALRQCRLRQRG